MIMDMSLAIGVFIVGVVIGKLIGVALCSMIEREPYITETSDHDCKGYCCDEKRARFQ